MERTLAMTPGELKEEIAANLAALYPVEWEELQSNVELRGKSVLLRQEGQKLEFVRAYDALPPYTKLEQNQILAKIPAPPKPSTPKISKYSGDVSWRLHEVFKKQGKNPIKLTPSGEKVYPVEGQESPVFSPDTHVNRRSVSQTRREVDAWDGIDVLPEDSLNGIAS